MEFARLQYVASLHQVEEGLVKEVERLQVVGEVSPEEIRALLLPHLPPSFTVAMCVPGLASCVSGRLVPLHTSPKTLAEWTLPQNGSCRRYHLSYREEVDCGCVSAAIHTSAVPLYNTLPRLDLTWTLIPQPTASLSRISECQAGVVAVREVPGYQHEVTLPLDSDGSSLKVFLCTSNITHCPGGYITLLDVHHDTCCLTLASGERVTLDIPQHTCGCSSFPSTIANTTTLDAALTTYTLTVTHCGVVAFPASPFNLTRVLTHLARTTEHDNLGCGDLQQPHTTTLQTKTALPSCLPTRESVLAKSQSCHAISSPKQNTAASVTHTHPTSVPNTSTKKHTHRQTPLAFTTPPPLSPSPTVDVNEVIMAVFEAPPAYSTASHSTISPPSLLSTVQGSGVMIMLLWCL